MERYNKLIERRRIQKIEKREAKAKGVQRNEEGKKEKERETSTDERRTKGRRKKRGNG